MCLARVCAVYFYLRRVKMRFGIRIADAETRRRAALKHYELGFTRYILVRGVLKFALPLFLFFNLYSYFVIGNHRTALVIVEYTASICVVMGLLVAVANWLVIRRTVSANR